MSSQFSYELDERQIKILMQSGEVDYNETAWQRFETNLSREVNSSSVSSGFSPKINFGISRSIIVPILFVGLIGGLSVLLFSFVDFKKKDEVVTEVPLTITPPVVKKPAVTPKKTSLTKTEPVKPAKDPVQAATPTVQTEIKQPATTVAETKKPGLTVQTSQGQSSVKETVTAAKTINPATKTETKETVVPNKKKKRRRITSEDLPSITTPANLNSSIEPELELK